MREQQNPSTPELHQPLLFAPSELLACGLRDAHHHPLVGVRTEDGVRSWRTSPATEWEHPLVEWARTAYLKELETIAATVVIFPASSTASSSVRSLIDERNAPDSSVPLLAVTVAQTSCQICLGSSGSASTGTDTSESQKAAISRSFIAPLCLASI